LQPVASSTEQHVFRFEKLPFVLALGDLDHPGNSHLGAADKIIDLVFPEQKFDALCHLAGDPTRTIHHFAEIETDVLRRDAKRVRFLQ
jgi:hypothetical protein